MGANAVVKGKIPDNSIAVGSPAHVVKKWDNDTENWEAC